MPEFITRRQLLRGCGGGMGSVALSALLADQGLLSNSAIAEGNPFASKKQHFPVKAKSVIWLFMNGGPSQVDGHSIPLSIFVREKKSAER